MKPGLIKVIAPTALCLLLASCAQLGPPLPPSLELPKPPSDLRAVRKGNRVTLSWSPPILTTDRQSVRYVGPTLVCRSSEADITDCKNPIEKLPALPVVAARKTSKKSATQKSSAPRPETDTFTDTFPVALETQDPAAEITYAVEVLNRNSRSAGLSTRVHVPAVLTLPPPVDLATELTGEGIVLTWTSAAEPSHPGLQFLYRIYRRDESSGKDAIAGEVSVSAAETGPRHFTDSAFEWEKTYLYRVTAVSVIQRADSELQVEGEDTSPVRVLAHDVFPPSVPSGVQAVFSGEGQKPFIDLIWAPVTNADLAGYSIYRRAGDGAAVKLNRELVKSPAYRDTEVTAGKTYSYSVSGVDVRGNESGKSEETSESVP
jgi:fibronectin type 3 domain-containing protein